MPRHGRPYHRLTAEDRAQFARERRALERSLITQEGLFNGALVVEHIGGSQYRVQLKDGSEVFASHKKQKDRTTGLSFDGWKLWEDRSESR